MSSHQGWSSTAPTYSSNIGRTSAFAADRLSWLANELSPITSTSRILDNGAGTGAVTFALVTKFPSTQILAIDISAKMLDNISQAQLPNVKTHVLDAQSLRPTLQEESFTHVFSTFMLQTITDPSSTVREMNAVLTAGGLIGVALWARRNGPFEVWERACQSLDASYELPPPFDDPHAWRTCGELEGELKAAGFIDVQTEEVTMPFPFEGAENFAEFWFGARNPAAERCMSNWKGDWKAVRKAVETVCREEFANGKDIYTWAVLGLGKKAKDEKLYGENNEEL